MKDLAEHMAFYGSYHRDWRNRLTHFIGVPLIMFSILNSHGLTAHRGRRCRAVPGDVVHAGRLGLLLFARRGAGPGDDGVHGSATCARRACGGLAARHLRRGIRRRFRRGLDYPVDRPWVRGQKKPALFDNLFQVIVAPIFLMAELFFGLGAKRALRTRVETLIEQRMP